MLSVDDPEVDILASGPHRALIGEKPDQLTSRALRSSLFAWGGARDCESEGEFMSWQLNINVNKPPARLMLENYVVAALGVPLRHSASEIELYGVGSLFIADAGFESLPTSVRVYPPERYVTRSLF